jgi:hypothetical protein
LKILSAHISSVGVTKPLARNITVERLTILLPTWKVAVSILGPEKGYPQRDFCGFTQSLQTMRE